MGGLFETLSRKKYLIDKKAWEPLDNLGYGIYTTVLLNASRGFHRRVSVAKPVPCKLREALKMLNIRKSMVLRQYINNTVNEPLDKFRGRECRCRRFAGLNLI